MKLAIHERKKSFSDRWIEYCDKYSIPYKIVNCYDNDIIEQLSDCDGLMWHWDLTDYKAALFARQLTISLEKSGLKVFPNTNTAWHYDDKLGQKYLLEAIDAPSVPTHVFYTKSEALGWIESANFPLVFKLRGGAGALNVKLVKNTSQAKKLIRKAFSKGFSSRNRSEKLRSRIINLRKNTNSENLMTLIKSIFRIFIPTEVERFSPKQKGYIYFQDFISNNDFDNRVVVMRDKCYAVRRYNRENDFRASGSGNWAFEKELFDLKAIRLALDVAKKLDTQSIAFDIIKDGEEFKIIEVSYCWSIGLTNLTIGYWDSDLIWHPEQVNYAKFHVQDLINEINNSQNVTT